MRSAPKSNTIRRTLHFAGRVQRVGFRYTTCEIASRFAVVGFVRNLPDGRVQLVAEGEPAEVDRFEEAIGATMRSFIRETTRQESPGTGEFSAFDVRD